MKKILLLILAIMPSLLVHSQEADNGNYTELTIHSRLEANTYYDSSIKELGFDLGNSSIYSLFEGKYNNLSWTISTHFINAGGDYAWPYTSLGYSYTTNFLDYLVARYEVGDFTFSLGKDMIKTGGMEFEEWDWDIHSVLVTPLWNNLSSYQWGVSVDWAATDNDIFSLQATTSPFGERPFSSKLYAYSFQWRGDIDWISFLWSASALGKAPGKYDILLCAGQTFHISNRFELTADWNNNYGMHGFDYSSGLGAVGAIKGHTIKLNAIHTLNDKFDFNALMMYSTSSPYRAIYPALYTIGLAAHYYPIEDLRIHALISHEFTNKISYFTVGARYSLSLIK